MRIVLWCLSIALVSAACSRNKTPATTDGLDVSAVLRAGDMFVMTNKFGTMQVDALSNRRRAFTWDGDTREVTMLSRKEPWRGALGLYWPGSGDHWKDHQGVTRAVIQEQRRDFKDEYEFRAWLKDELVWYDAQYTPDGVVGGWSIQLERNQLNVELWQITIGGEKPQSLSGGSTGWLTWSHAAE